MNLDLIQLGVAVVAAVVGFLARGRMPQPAPTPTPNPVPSQFPLLELILKLLAERFQVPVPGQPLPTDSPPADEPPWVRQLLAEIRAAKRTL